MHQERKSLSRSETWKWDRDFSQSITEPGVKTERNWLSVSSALSSPRQQPQVGRAGCWCFSLDHRAPGCARVMHRAMWRRCPVTRLSPASARDSGRDSVSWAMSESQYWTSLSPVQTCWQSAPTCRVNTSQSESVVSRIIGENSQISRQQISSSSYYNLAKWWVKHSRYLSLKHEYFLGCLECIFWCDHYPLECHLSCQVSWLSSRLTPGSHSSPLVFRDLMPKMPRALATWHLLQQSQGASSVESHHVERTAVSIFPETIKLWDNQNRVYAAPAEMFWHSRHPQILRFWWVLWCKFYQFSNDLIDPKAWVVIELQISTGNSVFTDLLLLYESS